MNMTIPITRFEGTIGSYHWIGKLGDSGYDIYFKDKCDECKCDSCIIGPYFLYHDPLLDPHKFFHQNSTWCVIVSNFNANTD